MPLSLLTRIKHRFDSSEFLRHNAIFFTGSFIVAALNYLYYPVLGRLMAPAQFGEVQALVSIFMQATIFLGVVTNVAVNVVANEPDHKTRDRIVHELERLATGVVVAGVIVALLFLPWVQSFFQFPDRWPFIILALSLLVAGSSTLRAAYLRGLNLFGKLSAVSILAAALKLVASAVFVLVGFGSAGAIGGLVVSQVISYFYTARLARQEGYHPPPGQWLKLLDLSILKPQLPYSLLVLVVSIVTTTQFSFDILVVKHYFPAEQAGIYAGIATIARIIYFLTGSVAGVLLSTVKREAPPEANRALLLRSMLLQSVLGGAALLVFAVAPHLVVKILIGSKYLGQAGLLPELSLALFVIAFINLLLIYDLALRRKSSAVVAVLGAGLTALFVGLSHATPTAVVRSLLISAILMLVIRGLDSLRRQFLRGNTAWPNRPH